MVDKSLTVYLQEKKKPDRKFLCRILWLGEMDWNA